MIKIKSSAGVKVNSSWDAAQAATWGTWYIVRTSPISFRQMRQGEEYFALINAENEAAAEQWFYAQPKISRTYDDVKIEKFTEARYAELNSNKGFANITPSDISRVVTDKKAVRVGHIPQN
jgi:hypothetical protein